MGSSNPVQVVATKTIAAVKRSPSLTGSLFFSTILLFIWYQWTFQDQFTVIPGSRINFHRTWNYERDRHNLLLDDNQCKITFPRLFEEIDRAVESRRERPITIEEIDSIEPKNGYVRAMIYDQELYVIHVQGNIYSRELATLHAIHRAITSSPHFLPNIEFTFNTDDIVFEPVPMWAYARKAEDTHIWLIPDFGYWSWPETHVGTIREVQMKSKVIENDQGFTWRKKIPKLLWRGATLGLPLRDRLLEVTRDRPWADVVSIDWHNNVSMSQDLKSMPEHCQYKYLAHTEGNSYSGRLKYLQSCESVIIAHKMDWIQHHHPLMRSSGSEQNYIEIDRDFNMLERTVLELQRQDAWAEKIAANSVKTFRERYLTPAAEACYWRALFKGWAEVSFEPQFYRDDNGTQVWRGLPVESFLLERRMHWDPY